jgi:hypothetical protein
MYILDNLFKAGGFMEKNRKKIAIKYTIIVLVIALGFATGFIVKKLIIGA